MEEILIWSERKWKRRKEREIDGGQSFQQDSREKEWRNNEWKKKLSDAKTIYKLRLMGYGKGK